LDNDLRNDTKAGQDENIDLRMPKESEKVLIEDWVTPAGRVEERRIKISVCQKYCDCPSEDRQ